MLSFYSYVTVGGMKWWLLLPVLWLSSLISILIREDHIASITITTVFIILISFISNWHVCINAASRNYSHNIYVVSGFITSWELTYYESSMGIFWFVSWAFHQLWIFFISVPRFFFCIILTKVDDTLNIWMPFNHFLPAVSRIFSLCLGLYLNSDIAL